MKRDELEALMVSQLYGELSADGKRALDEWLQSHPEDRAEFEALGQTCALLDRLRTPDESSDSVVCPLPLYRKTLRHWRKGLMAAACFAFLFVCVSQGFVLQVGSFRIGTGLEEQTPNIKEIIRQELTANYLPTLSEVVNTVEAVNTSRDLMVQRQEALEASFANLSAIQKINERKFEMALNELVDGIDERLRPYLASAQAPRYRQIPLTDTTLH